MNSKLRVEFAKKSLSGVSIGDAFGESFFGDTEQMVEQIERRNVPESSWEFTDDTVMAIAIFRHLCSHQEVDQDKLAHQFAINHELDVNRGYGATARRILREIGNGTDWKAISSEVFDGMGSMGNGAAMRAAPIGAYYFDNLDIVKEWAMRTAEVTHFNIEGKCGATAVAIATAIATKMQVHQLKMAPNEFIELVASELPDTDTAAKIRKSMTISATAHIDTLRTILGNGSKVMAQDTVPFAIWCAAHHLGNFEEALWKAVSALGDRDTICAIVGGITIMSTNPIHIPESWAASVEKIETSVFYNGPQ